MLFEEFSLEDYVEVAKQEAYEIGIEKGRRKNCKRNEEGYAGIRY